MQQLIIEAEAQMMSEQSLRNDPQGRGFHGGDPELRATLTSDPRERRGREFKGPDDIYGSKPDVYRSIIIPEEGDTSPIFYPKYLGEGVGFFPADQYKPGSPKETNMNILGYYDKDLDEIGLLRTTDVVGEYGGLFDNIADETEAHEYIHRYAGKGGDAAADHQYIEQAFSDLEPVTADNAAKKTEELLENFLITQEQREIMKNMDSFEKSFYINEQRQRIFQELIARNNLQNQITTFAKGGPTVIDGLPVVNPVADVGSITPISPFEMTETFGGPLYQMLNPSAKRMVDKLGLRGQGLGGFAAMVFSPQKKVTSAARLAQLANPTDEVFKTANRKEILDYIKTIPLIERIALRANDAIPLKGKYAILDSDKIDFYEDIVDLNKLPKNFKTGDNNLTKIYMQKNAIPARNNMTEKLSSFRPRPYFEEIVDKKGVEKIKLYFPKTGRLEPYGSQTKYRQKTLVNPSKAELDSLFKNMRVKNLQQQLEKIRKAEKLEIDPGSIGDINEAKKLRTGIPYRTSEEISQELLELQGAKKLNTDLLEKLRKQYNL